MIRGALALAILSAGCATHLYPDGSGLEGQLEREVIALNQRVRALAYDLETCTHGGDPGAIYAELHQLFSGTGVSVDRRGAITVVTLPVGHLFTDPYELRFREEATPSLDLLATALAAHPELRLVVEGHTDDAMLPARLLADASVGPEVAAHVGAPPRRFASHLDLSVQYASAVLDRLTALGVDEARFTLAGRGRWAPIATNDTVAGQARNMRVEVHVYPAGAQ